MFEWVRNLFRKKAEVKVEQVRPSEDVIHAEQEEYFAKHGRYLQTPHVDVYEAPGPDRDGPTVHGYRIRNL